MLLLFSALVATTSAEGKGVPLLRGWNLGNTLETPCARLQYMGLRSEWIFETVKSKGFDWVRIPVHWGCHTTDVAPHRVDPGWLAEVNQTVGWARQQGLRVMVNAHAEDWLDNSTGTQACWTPPCQGVNPRIFATQLPKMIAIWTQVSRFFVDVPDDELVFELFNEPYYMNVPQLNELYAALLPAVRRSSATRQVHLGGLAHMKSSWILNNPDALKFPSNDQHLALTTHSYDPNAFSGAACHAPAPPPCPSVTDTTFGASDQQMVRQTFAHLGMWSTAHREIPVYHTEFGVAVFQHNLTAKALFYRTYADGASEHGVGWAVWDDDGWFRILNRKARTWNRSVTQALVGGAKLPFSDSNYR